MSQKAGAIIIYPFYSKLEKDANRVIIRAQKDANGPLTLKSGMVVHKYDGNYSEKAEDVLRRVNYLDITK
jgi:tRNA1(Val) A37 N6-methylase TrmN6